MTYSECLGAIASKAQYIQDLAIGILAGNVHDPLPEIYASDILRQLQAIADVLDEYHDFGLDDD